MCDEVVIIEKPSYRVNVILNQSHIKSAYWDNVISRQHHNELTSYWSKVVLSQRHIEQNAVLSQRHIESTSTMHALKQRWTAHEIVSSLEIG